MQAKHALPRSSRVHTPQISRVLKTLWFTAVAAATATTVLTGSLTWASM